MPTSPSPRYRLGPRISPSAVIKCKRRRPVFVDFTPLLPPQSGQQLHPTKQQTIEKQFFSIVKRPGPHLRAQWQSLPTGPRLGQYMTGGQAPAASEKQRKSTVKQ
ncbi:hypothetical protein C0Q70_05800 [Pomacea canaliculata]|uniref:Uncharacterized protein n=1 Tax=Pomacea canaliculata TaxID=400727 RepID=A0A2T7PM75_POMCA|nr:hypothetical protein C0Q70_05800 [Pomacea canaliculata]